MPFLTEQFGNPHSRTHVYGWNAESAVEKAREDVANLIGADPKEIIFTSVRARSRAHGCPAPPPAAKHMREQAAGVCVVHGLGVWLPAAGCR